MRRAFNSSYIMIPLVYVLIIGGLLFLQFSGGSLFRSDVGPLSLTASFTMGASTKDKTISAVQVSVMGMQFVFDSKQNIQIQAQDDSMLSLPLKGYETRGDGFLLHFEQGLDLQFESPRGSSNLALLNLNLPAALLPLKSIRIPYQPLGGAQTKSTPNMPTMDVSYGGNEYLMSLPARSFVDSSKQQLVIPGDEIQKNLRLGIKAQKGEDLYNRFIANQTWTVSDAEYKSQVQAFFNSAYNAWKSSRYNSANGSWAHRDGESRFDENIMVALLSEAWQKNEYTRVYTEMRNAADQNITKLSWKSSAFLGNLKRMSNEMIVQDRKDAELLQSRIQKADHDLLLKSGLVQFAVDRASEKTANDLKSYFDGLQVASLTPTQVLGLLQHLYVWEIPDPAFESSLGRFSTLLNESVLPNLVPVDGGYYFQSVPGKADIYNTLLAGRILIGAGIKTGDDRFGNLGRHMIVSVLKLSDDAGYLPEAIEFSGEAVTAMVKSRGGEDFYELLQSNPSYPKSVSLFRKVGRGAWMNTIATVNAIDIKPGEYNFNITYPRSRTHYIMLAGLKPIDPLEGMQLFGITWRNASDFEIYSKGRYYNPDTRILMIKYFDDAGTRDFKIWYR